MATSKDFTTSVVKSSEEHFDICCSPCNEAGSTKEAKHFCVDCESYLCVECLLNHNRFKALRSHNIVDTSGNERTEQKETETCLPTERCAIHHGKLIDMYCWNHDEVCCSACIAIKHRSCVNVDYLPDIAKGTNDSAEFKETLSSLKHVLVNIKQERDDKVGNLASLDQQKDLLLKQVGEYESELIKKIKDLAEDAKNQISAKNEEYMKSVQKDVDILDTVISTVATSVQKFTSKNEAELFMNVKSGKKSVQDCKNLLREVSPRSGKKKELKFTPNIGLRGMITSIGSISEAEEEIMEYKATLYGKFRVSSNRCQVLGTCVMEDGTFLVSDYTNRKLKRLNRDFTVKDQIDIDSLPYSLQIVGPAEIAVFCQSGPVYLVSVREVMKVTASFDISEGVSGGLCSTGKNEMFLLKHGQMCICRKNGDIVRTIKMKTLLRISNRNKLRLVTTTTQSFLRIIIVAC